MMNFAEKLAAMVALKTANATAEEYAEVIERLIATAGFVIAIASRGEPETMNAMLEGASSHLFNEASGKQKFAQFMSGVTGGMGKDQT